MEAHNLTGITYEANLPHDADEVAIIVSKWNKEITEALYEGAVDTLVEAGIGESFISRFDVPGSFELPGAAKMVLESRPSLDGIICLGCIIQGETRHFEFISQAVAQGIMQVNLEYAIPVIFGVLTPDNMKQAQNRAGGIYGNKGAEAAVALLEMIDLKKAI